LIFVDTVAWLYLFDQRQDNHDVRKARNYVRQTNEALCTSDLVIAETYKWLIHHGRPTGQAIKVLKSLTSGELAVILPIEQEDRDRALSLLRAYSDHKLSYEDSITVCLARRFGLSRIFSFDKHFLLFPSLERVPD
jgi:uncharacterized protein